jgi:transposase
VLKALILRGPDLARDGCVAGRLRDLCRLVECRSGVASSATGMLLRLLHSLDLSWQKARPIHPEADLKAQARFKKPARRDAGRGRPAPRGDADRAVVRGPGENRPGGPRDPRLVPKQRPRGGREQRFASAHLFGAVCPERATGVALVLPEANTAAMNLLRAERARAGPDDTHAVVVLDRAGWHISGDLAVPANLTLLHLPSKSPELTPLETAWQDLRERYLSHRVLPDNAGHPRRRLRRLARPLRRARTVARAHQLPLAAPICHHFMRAV